MSSWVFWFEVFLVSSILPKNERKQFDLRSGTIVLVKFLVRFLGEFQKGISKLTDLYSTFKWCAYRSKYSAHHSQSSVLLIPLSYLIPAVKIVKRLIWSESIFDPAQISLFTISTLNFFSLNLTEFLKRNSVKYFYFMLVILFLVTNLVPYTRAFALHASEGVWWEKMWKRCCKGRETSN